jgi:hypothetical protein
MRQTVAIATAMRLARLSHPRMLKLMIELSSWYEGLKPIEGVKGQCV